MNIQRLTKYKGLYITVLPIPFSFSTFMGIDIGISINKIKPDENFINSYSKLIGYTSIGIITGLTYPVSYPLLACYVLYKT
jgi:hypothetical protein